MRTITKGFLLAVCALLPTACAMQRRVYVETPNSCYRVDRVEDDQVYLVSHGKVCLQVPGHDPVELDPGIRRIRIYTDGKPWRDQTVPPPSQGR